MWFYMKLSHWNVICEWFALALRMILNIASCKNRANRPISTDLVEVPGLFQSMSTDSVEVPCLFPVCSTGTEQNENKPGTDREQTVNSGTDREQTENKE